MKSGMGVIILICLCAAAHAQGNSSISDKFYFGGGGSFGAGTNTVGNRYVYYGLYPMAGYRVTEQFSTGMGLTYQHYSFPDFGPDYSYAQYGLMPFARYNFGSLFFQSEFDVINSPKFTDASRSIYNRLLFGVGWSMPLSDQSRSAINAMAMYDVLYRQPSVFNSPIVFRVFVTF